jgi:hypothetical protein
MDNLASSMMTFDPTNPALYDKGQVVLYNDILYYVLKDIPDGIPGSSPDFSPIGGATGATGPAGTASTTNYDPDEAPTYQKGQVVVGPDDTPYVAQKDNPSGVPGSSPDYKPLTGGVGPTGPTGPAGTAAMSNYDPAQAPTYQKGQVVVGPDGTPYVAQKDDPSGAPGSSPDYKPLTGGVGPTGATGEPGPAGATGASLYAKQDKMVLQRQI